MKAKIAKIKSGLLERADSLGLIFLFLWISFFAPFVSGQWRFKFLLLPGVLLTASLCFKKSLYKSILNKTEIPFYIFLLTMISGIAGARADSVAYWYLWSFIFPAPLLYLFAKAAFKEDHGLFIMQSACLMALLVCICGIIEYLSKQNFIYTYFIKNIYFEAFKGRRMVSTQVHPTALGTYLIAILPLSFVVFLKAKRLLFKAFWGVCMAVFLISVIFTSSRGAILGAFTGIFIMIILLLKEKRLFILSLILLLAAIIVASTILLNLDSVNFYRYSLQELSSGYNYWGKISRFLALGGILRDHPFFGIGFGNFRVLFDHYLPHLANSCSYDSKVADCMYISILAETGLIGFSGFVLFITFLFKRIWASLGSQPQNKLFLVSFSAGLIGMLCGFLTYDGLYWVAPSYLFWSYAGILSSLTDKTIKEVE